MNCGIHSQGMLGVLSVMYLQRQILMSVCALSFVLKLQAFYFPWAMLALDVIFGSPIWPDLLGIIAGHLYHFLTVLHPLAGGKNILKTPRWVYPYFLFNL